jgi:hypothetical protein
MFAAGKRTRQNFGQLNIAPTDRGLSKSRGKEAALAENRAERRKSRYAEAGS